MRLVQHWLRFYACWVVYSSVELALLGVASMCAVDWVAVALVAQDAKDRLEASLDELRRNTLKPRNLRAWNVDLSTCRIIQIAQERLSSWHNDHSITSTRDGLVSEWRQSPASRNVSHPHLSTQASPKCCSSLPPGERVSTSCPSPRIQLLPQTIPSQSQSAPTGLWGRQ